MVQRNQYGLLLRVDPHTRIKDETNLQKQLTATDENPPKNVLKVPSWKAPLERFFNRDSNPPGWLQACCPYRTALSGSTAHLLEMCLSKGGRKTNRLGPNRQM